MEKKEIKVEVPEGMEVDLEKSIMNEHEVSIVYKAIKKYEDYDDVYKGLNSIASLDMVVISTDFKKHSDYYHSEEQIEKLVAINKLHNIANYYNKVEIDWNKDEQKYHIYYCSISKEKYFIQGIESCNNGGVYFLNKQDAQSVIDNPNFRKILDKIYK